jgi:hypothetical protein
MILKLLNISVKYWNVLVAKPVISEHWREELEQSYLEQTFRLTRKGAMKAFFWILLKFWVLLQTKL